MPQICALPRSPCGCLQGADRVFWLDALLVSGAVGKERCLEVPLGPHWSKELIAEADQFTPEMLLAQLQEQSIYVCSAVSQHV